MSGQEITITSVDGDQFMGYRAMPPSGEGPGVVVIQEIFGVNQVMRDLTDWVASEGFVALWATISMAGQPGWPAGQAGRLAKLIGNYLQ